MIEVPPAPGTVTYLERIEPEIVLHTDFRTPATGRIEGDRTVNPREETAESQRVLRIEQGTSGTTLFRGSEWRPSSKSTQQHRDYDESSLRPPLNEGKLNRHFTEA